MATLVVQAHPLEESYNAAIRDRVVAALERSGESTTVVRLGQGERADPRQLSECERLILVYPTWSSGLPAMLLRWVHDALDEPAALSRVSEVAAVTSCGSSRLVNTVQGQWGKRYLRTVLRAHCAPGARFRWLPLYKIDRCTRADTDRHLDRLERQLMPRRS